MNDNQRRGIWKLRRDGFGYGAIAQMLNLSLGSVKQYCRRHPELKGVGQFVKYQLDEGERPYCKNCMKNYTMLSKADLKSSAQIAAERFGGETIKANTIKPKLHTMN